MSKDNQSIDTINSKVSDQIDIEINKAAMRLGALEERSKLIEIILSCSYLEQVRTKVAEYIKNEQVSE